MLASMGEMLIKVLSKDDLDDKMKDTRDQFLEKLEVKLLYMLEQSSLDGSRLYYYWAVNQT